MPDRRQPAPPFAAVTSPDRCAFGLLELSSIARGVVVADAAVKQAPSLLLISRPVSSGKHLVMMRGQVAEIEESMRAARDAASQPPNDALIDDLELPYLSEAIWPHLARAVGAAPAHDTPASSWRDDPDAESVAIVETGTVCATLHAADAALKAAPVTIRDLALAQGIGGRAYFSLTGLLSDIEAAAEAASAAAGHRVLGLEIIARPADELRGQLFF
ncbi:MAG: BMC domain-containing protein [Haliangiales bacterium]